MTEIDVRIANLDALTVSADELLVLRWDSEVLPADVAEFEEMMNAMYLALDESGFRGRYIIFVGDVEIAKVAKGDR